MRTSALFAAQEPGFLEIYGMSALRTDKWGGDWARTNILRTRGSIFRDFMRTSFMDGP